MGADDNRSLGIWWHEIPTDAKFATRPASQTIDIYYQGRNLIRLRTAFQWCIGCGAVIQIPRPPRRAERASSNAPSCAPRVTCRSPFPFACLGTSREVSKGFCNACRRIAERPVPRRSLLTVMASQAGQCGWVAVGKSRTGSLPSVGCLKATSVAKQVSIALKCTTSIPAAPQRVPKSRPPRKARK